MASAELDIQIPGYCINRRIGAGATGTVYEAEEQHGGKGVVIKIIHPHLVRKESVREAFLQAVTIVISLDHPGVVPALMAGEAEGGGLYVVSACAEGSSLTDLLAQKGALSEKRALALLADLAGVLSVAHEAKLVHGNLTPENIWVRGDAIQGRVSVMDFGMAPLHVAAGDEEQRPPYYLSPEQIKGEAPSVRSDVYALGILAFQLLTGRLPFSSPKPRDVLLMHLNDEPPPPGDLVEMSSDTEVFLFQALSKDPRLRFQDMAAVKQALTGGGVPAPAPAKSGPGELSLNLETARPDDDLVVLGGTGDDAPTLIKAREPVPDPLKMWDHAEASGQIDSDEPTLLDSTRIDGSDPDSIIAEEGTPVLSQTGGREPSGVLTFDMNTGTAQQISRGMVGDVDPIATGLLPRPDKPPDEDIIMTDEGTQLLPAMLGLITAVGVGLISFKLLTGAWPFPLGD